MNKDEPSSYSSTRPVTNHLVKVEIESNMKKMSKLASRCAGMTMHSEDETSESESDEEEFYRNLGRGNAFVALDHSVQPLESESKDDESCDDEPTSHCLMEKSSKDQVSSKHHKSMTKLSSKNITYVKMLVKIANYQQDELDRLERNLKKSKGLLV